jgi:soluble lytic murein transglycosylase
MSIVSLNNSTSPSASSNAIAASPSGLEAAAEQFEALFLQQVLKQMRKAGDVLAADNPMRSRELDTMRDFYDGMLADTLASKRQTGIADLLVKQLSGNTNQQGTIENASEAARAAALPERTSMDSLRSTWQRGVDSLANVWNKGSAGFSALVDSVIKQESAGQVDAVSPKGALGIMQLMPDTARQMAQELGVNFNLGRLTRDADYNKQLGSAFLSKLLERYDGEQALAVAAYNAGPARVDEWLERHGDPRIGDISVSAWVRQIPFKETREYTSKVLAELSQVSNLSPGQGASSATPLIPGQERFKSTPIPVALTESIAKESTENVSANPTSLRWVTKPIRE